MQCLVFHLLEYEDPRLHWLFTLTGMIEAIDWVLVLLLGNGLWKVEIVLPKRGLFADAALVMARPHEKKIQKLPPSSGKLSWYVPFL